MGPPPKGTPERALCNEKDKANKRKKRKLAKRMKEEIKAKPYVRRAVLQRGSALEEEVRKRTAG